MNEKSIAAGIAIVDDEVSVINAYKRLFEMNGLAVSFVALNGIDALNALDDCDPMPSVYLIDFRLPGGMTGIDLAREVLKRQPASRIIILSTDPDIRDDVLKAGAASFIKKPALFKVLVKVVKGEYYKGEA